jgi:Virulence-associated protein E
MDNTDHSLEVKSENEKTFVDTLLCVGAIRSYFERVESDLRAAGIDCSVKPHGLKEGCVAESYETGKSTYEREIFSLRLDPNSKEWTIRTRDGNIADAEEHPKLYPTNDEKSQIDAGLDYFKFPEESTGIQNLSGNEIFLFENGKKIPAENIVECRRVTGELVFVEIRKDGKNGKKTYIPWTIYTDGKWRCAVPENGRPLYGLEKLKDVAKDQPLMIHEGAKDARGCHEMCNGLNPAALDRAKMCPILTELKGMVHLAFTGGAFAAYRNDWREINKRKGAVVYYSVDNDQPGRDSVKSVSKALKLECYQLLYNRRFPSGFGLGDPWPQTAFGRPVKFSFIDSLQCMTWMDDPIEVEGKKIYEIRESAKGVWLYFSKEDMVYCKRYPHMKSTGFAFSADAAAFSHGTTKSATALTLIQDSQSQKPKRAYLPGESSWDGTSLNMYRKSKITPIQGDVSPFLEYMTHLVPDKRERDAVLTFLATCIKYPGRKLHFMLVLYSREKGTGKSKLLDLLSHLVGSDGEDAGSGNAGTIDAESAKSRFNYGYLNKHVMLWNEMLLTNPEQLALFKGRITDDVLKIEGKGIESFDVPNVVSFVATTNDVAGLMLETGDRRFLIVQCSETSMTPAKTKEYFHWLQELGGYEAILHWFQNEWNSFYETGDRPIETDIKKEAFSQTALPEMEEILSLMNHAADQETPIALTVDSVFSFFKLRNPGTKINSTKMREIISDHTAKRMSDIKSIMDDKGELKTGGEKNQWKVAGAMEKLIGNKEFVRKVTSSSYDWRQWVVKIEDLKKIGTGRPSAGDDPRGHEKW